MKIKGIAIIGTLVFVAVLAMLISSNNAQADNHYWNGIAGDPAGNPAKWNPVITNWGTSDLKFGATANTNCNYNLSTMVNSIQIFSNYTQTITQGSNDINIGTGGYSQGGGIVTFIGGSTYWVNCQGNFIWTSGTLTDQKLRLNSIGTGTILTFPSACNVFSFKMSGSSTLATTNYIEVLTDTNIAGTLTIPNGKAYYIQYESNKVSTFVNTGIIQGTGKVGIMLCSNDMTSSLGNITCTLEVNSRGNVANRVLTLGATNNVTALTVLSTQTVFTTTVNLAGNSLTANGAISISTRGIISSTVNTGILIGKNGISTVALGLLNGTNLNRINCTGNFDSSLGTYVKGNCILNFFDSNYTIKQSTSQSISKINVISQITTYYKINANHIVPLNVTGLFANRVYTIYVNNSINTYVKTNSIGNLYLTFNYPSERYFKITGNATLIITSTPINNMTLGNFYNYYPKINANGIFFLSASTTEIILYPNNTAIGGRPTGIGNISISLKAVSVDGQISYQNYTLTVNGSASMIDTGTMVFLVWIILMFALFFISVYAMEWGIIAGLVWIIASLVTFIPLNGVLGLLVLAIGLLLMGFGLNEYLER